MAASITDSVMARTAMARSPPSRATSPTLHRVKVPGTEWDTSRPDDGVAVKALILDHRMYDSDLVALVAALEALPVRTEFENDVLMLARYSHAGARDINDVYDKARDEKGVWTKATVLVNGTEVRETPPERAGIGEGIEGTREYHEKPTEMTESENDSEVKTLAHLTEFIFDQNPSGWTNVNVIFSGSMGPCNGCKQRLTEFMEQVDAYARELNGRFRLVLDVNYTTQTNTSTMRKTTYGYDDDAPVTRLPDTDDEYEYWTRGFVKDCGR
jgi:hypothetical protein